MERRILIAGNWKMNKTVEEAALLASGLASELSGVEAIDLLVCPPSICIGKVVENLADSPIDVGAQNMYYEESGAFTGEISPQMIISSGAEFVIIGHSERRHVFGESDELIAKKVAAGIDAGLKVILCIGELLEERESGDMENVLIRQLETALSGLSEDRMKRLIIAYEPVWAIGTGKTATSDQADDAHKFVRGWLESNFSSKIANEMVILYGGSVKPKNAYELLSCENVDGALVGGASLKIDSFKGIVDEGLKVIENVKSSE